MLLSRVMADTLGVLTSFADEDDYLEYRLLNDPGLNSYRWFCNKK
uniref:Uncharacterized protein n=1 Tax=Candidatus Kentrum sp. MB TaxID=2138164 RepID=A0A451BFR4_9GAMM|nr:MAG: hypothetical protein BECKMB1821I_GA0114274_11116 [Candidatus Kentron sp. MB]VFK77134.1 MAG: hypothetical protein BECKMB1821H_GA0114242_11028 [Candidatus Kentron sp. MB]